MLRRILKWTAIALAGGVALALLVSMLTRDDPQSNERPKFGAGLGLPTNCRALIQRNLDGVRARQFTAEEALGSIERNCGANGSLWER